MGDLKVGDLVAPYVVPIAATTRRRGRGIVVGKGPFPSSHRVFWFSQCYVAVVHAYDLMKVEDRGD